MPWEAYQDVDEWLSDHYFESGASLDQDFDDFLERQLEEYPPLLEVLE